jgi:hypothetical protein
VERIGPGAEGRALEVDVDGQTVRVMTRRPGGDEGRQFESGPSRARDGTSRPTDEDLVRVVRELTGASIQDEPPVAIVGVAQPGVEFPGDAPVPTVPVQPVSFSLPGSPTGLALHMDERGDGRLEAIDGSGGRLDLGSDGMWWIVSRLIEALEDPEAVAEWPRFLTLGTRLGGPATQASLETEAQGLRIVWRGLRSGIVGDVVAVQELSSGRASGWLTLLRPVRESLERDRAHRQRMRPARTAERWARALERWETQGP